MSRRSQFYVSRRWQDPRDLAPTKTFGFLPSGGRLELRDTTALVFDADNYPMIVPLGTATLFYVEVGVHDDQRIRT